jgi:hypothetical protein
VLRNDVDYNTDSSEAQEVKETITFFKKQAAAVVEQIQNMKQKPSSITMTAATGEPTASTLSSESLGPGSDSDDNLPASSGLSKAANDVDENKEE